MEIRCKVWLEKGGEMLFGKGRAQLLKALAEEGSLSRAARRLNMSYRAAWGKLQASEQHLGVKLAERSPLGRHGMTLTERGKLMLKEYERLLRETEKFFERRLERFTAALGGQKKAPRAGTRGAMKKKVQR